MIVHYNIGTYEATNSHLYFTTNVLFESDTQSLVLKSISTPILEWRNQGFAPSGDFVQDCLKVRGREDTCT